MPAKIAYWLLITLLLSLGFGQLMRFELFGQPVYLHDLLVLALIPLLAGSVKNLTLPTWSKYILVGMAIGWLRALTLFPLPDLLTPGLYALRLLSYLFLFLLLSRAPLILPRRIFLISLLVSLGIGLSQYYLMPDLRLFQYLGWDDHLYRLTLPHFDPAYSGSFLVIGFLSLHPTFRLVYPFAGFAVLLTYARAVWLTLFLTWAVSLKNLRQLLGILLILLMLVWALPDRFGEGTNLLRTYSISDRLTHDFRLARAVGINFLSGQGYNTLPLILSSSTPYSEHANSFNNSFLTILSTFGVVGLWGWYLLLRSLYTRSPAMRSIVLFLVIGSFFNNLLLYPFIFLWLLLSASVMAPSEV